MSIMFIVKIKYAISEKKVYTDNLQDTRNTRTAIVFIRHPLARLPPLYRSYWQYVILLL